MSKIGEAIGEATAPLIAVVIGWAFCMALLAGAFQLGCWIAPYLSTGEHPEAFGIISAVVFIWLYERSYNQSRWDDLHKMIERITPRREW